MGKIKNISIIISIGLLRRCSQVIFSVLYSPSQSNHLGIGSGSWTNNITMTGFELQQINSFVDSKPTPIMSGLLENFNNSCQYGMGSCKAFRGQDILTTLSRLNTIQYIGKDIDVSRPSDITNKFYDIHNSNPHRRYPHLFAQYIGPSTKKDGPDKDLARITRENTVKIGEEGIRYSCDLNKIDKISKLNYQEFLQAIADHNPEYRYPCNTDDLAHALAFNYYHYLDNIEKSSLYYMVASFHDETPKITLSMPAIMQGREGNNKISAFLRYDRLQNNYKELKNKDLPDDKRKQIEDNVTIALKKMVSEFSMHILTKATALAIENKQTEQCSHTSSCLKTKGEINTIIGQIESQCKTDTIACEILTIGKKSGRITTNGTLIYPVDTNMKYTWKEDKKLWRVESK